MKQEIGAIAAILAIVGLAVPVKAENPIQLKRLLETKECQGCDLSKANLKSTHLIGADLRNANLKGANLEGANLEGADLTAKPTPKQTLLDLELRLDRGVREKL
jgi:hypothetical protein